MTRRSSFAPCVLAGVAGAGAAAVAGSREWVQVQASGPVEAGEAGASMAPSAAVLLESHPGLGQMPLAGALGLVCLACWGVLLVTRGVWRRTVAWLGLAAALGLAATWVVGLQRLPDQVRETLADSGSAAGWDLGWTAWFWVAALACVAAVASGAVAALRAGTWPTMGSRYDAPTGRTGPQPAGAEASPAEGPAQWWKELDEGRDPTADSPP